MSLTLNQGKKMLHQIVGGSYSGQTITRWLGLSSTKPTNTPDAQGKYNITEPNFPSYARVQINPYFNVGEDATGTEVSGEYVITIKNEIEIHFNEAQENWGYVKYFAIFDTSSTTEPVYFGELVTEDPSGVEINANTVPLIKKEQLEISVK